MKENFRSLPYIKFFFYTWMIFVVSNSIENRIGNVWPCYIAGQNFVYIYISTSLLKSLFQISAKFSLLLIVLLLAFKIIDSLWKAFSKRTGRTVFQNFLLSCQRQLCLWSSFPQKNILVLRSRLRQKFLWRLKLLLDSSFLVFKNLFLSFDVFITAFLGSFVITLQLFERIYAIFWSAFVKNR